MKRDPRNRVDERMLKVARAARRKAALDAGGPSRWRPRAARFPDRKKEGGRRKCRGPHSEDDG